MQGNHLAVWVLHKYAWCFATVINQATRAMYSFVSILYWFLAIWRWLGVNFPHSTKKMWLFAPVERKWFITDPTVSWFVSKIESDQWRTCPRRSKRQNSIHTGVACWLPHSLGRWCPFQVTLLQMCTSCIFPYATRCNVTRDVSNCKTIRYCILGGFWWLACLIWSQTHITTWARFKTVPVSMCSWWQPYAFQTIDLILFFE